MPLPASFNTLLEQINKELNNLDLELYQAIELVRERLILFPDNIASIQLFVTLNNYALFAENTKRRIQEIIKYLAVSEILAERDI